MDNVWFGINIDPATNGVELAFDLARYADEAGMDLIGVQDHPYNGGFLDTWTLLSVLGARTERVRLFPNVAALPLRPPAMLAKAAASLDVLTKGRVELGLGAGALWDGIAAYGGPRRSPGEAVEALEEAIQVLHALWGRNAQGQRASFSGKHYQVAGAQIGPRPAHQIGIWLGALKPRMLQLTGKLADGWSISANWVPPETVPGLATIIDEAAREAGRDPLSLRRNYNLMGLIEGSGSVGVRARQPGMLSAPPSVWADTIARYQNDLGMNAFTFWPVAGETRDQMRRWAEEVVPLVRAR
jgi:alkanesulfonate monooxygenase SsuD/methylene tetrahydromethanopterin reductase-like flavin-dependent oxidoreductase (luciferase family)